MWPYCRKSATETGLGGLNASPGFRFALLASRSGGKLWALSLMLQLPCLPPPLTPPSSPLTFWNRKPKETSLSKLPRLCGFGFLFVFGLGFLVNFCLFFNHNTISGIHSQYTHRNINKLINKLPSQITHLKHEQHENSSTNFTIWSTERRGKGSAILYKATIEEMKWTTKTHSSGGYHTQALRKMLSSGL